MSVNLTDVKNERNRANAPFPIKIVTGLSAEFTFIFAWVAALLPPPTAD
jgi:hypothetical protein